MYSQFKDYILLAELPNVARGILKILIYKYIKNTQNVVKNLGILVVEL